MPIDPNIILSSRAAPIQQQDPLEQYGKSLALKGLLGQQDLQGLQLQTARQGLEDEQATRAAYQQSGGDNARLRALLVGGGQHKAVSALDKQLLESQKTQAGIDKDKAAAGKSQFDVQMGKLQHGAALLNEAKDPQSFDAVLRAGEIAGTFDPEFTAKMRAQGYSPQLVQALQSAGVTRAQQLEAQNRDATLAETVRGHDLTAQVGREGHAVTARGQNLTDARVRERLAFDQAQPKGQYDAERGMLVDPRTGTARPVTMDGQPITPKDKPLTESQGKASGMALRAQRANDILNTMEDAGETSRGIIKQGVEQIPVVGGGMAMGVNALPGIFGGPSGNQQKVEQARRDFINAALRVESGASISPSEFQNAERQYFPMPGDTPEVIKQKRQARQNEIEGLKLQTGPGEKRITSLPKIDPKKLSDAELKRELGI